MDANQFLHIYNRGNNSQRIFFDRENYLYFLKKIRLELNSLVDIVAYCLMPNHFHLLVYTTENFDKSKLTNSIGILLRSYTRAINKHQNRTGSLFQQHTKIKNISESKHSDYYSFICFHYIHQNPLRAGLVNTLNEWEMSSYLDYSGARNGSLCKKKTAYELIGIPENKVNFTEESHSVVNNVDVQKLLGLKSI